MTDRYLERLKRIFKYLQEYLLEKTSGEAVIEDEIFSQTSWEAVIDDEILARKVFITLCRGCPLLPGRLQESAGDLIARFEEKYDWDHEEIWETHGSFLEMIKIKE